MLHALYNLTARAKKKKIISVAQANSKVTCAITSLWVLFGLACQHFISYYVSVPVHTMFPSPVSSSPHRTKARIQRYKICPYETSFSKVDVQISDHPRRPRGGQSGREKRCDESFQAQAEKPLGTDSRADHFQTVKRILAPDWAPKRLCARPIGEQHLLTSFCEFVRDGYWLDHGLSGLCTKEIHAVRKLSVWYKLSILNYYLPENWRRFSKNTLKLELTTGIHACIDHTLVNIREFKMPRQQTADSHESKTSHEKWIHIFSVSIAIIPTHLLCQMQANSSGA